MRLHSKLLNKKASNDWRNTSQTLHDEGSKSFLGEVSAKKMQQVALSDNTIQRCISKMYMDMKEQDLADIKASPLFSFQLDESTDVSSCSQ